MRPLRRTTAAVLLDAALPWCDLKLQAGRVNLPFNYYNTRRFAVAGGWGLDARARAVPTTAQAIILDGRLIQAAAVITL